MLVGGWGKRLEGRRREGGVPCFGEYIPDQQGCYEVTTRDGGTLACGPAEYSGDRGLVRLGVAKAKGKLRVVTMQSAEVKRVLTPVHNALYDHISSFGWCVRGDVLKEDFEAVIDDLREGEEIISGDYSAATDNIYLDAVMEIVDVLSSSPELTALEKEVLTESFTNIRCQLTSCPLSERVPINRGSMMGNLVSFPLLCLLNKACHEIACDLSDFGPGGRVGRFNGDDCCFAGDARFFDTWVRITSAFGLVVNGEKTGRSARWCELNSHIYDAVRHRFVAKPVLSFLLTDRTKPGSILASVIRGIDSFRWPVRLRVVNDMMRYEISLRGVLSELSCLGPRWRAELLKRRWFRVAALEGPAPVKTSGTSRELETVVSSPPDSRVYQFVTEASISLSRERTDTWLGVRVRPLQSRIDRSSWRHRPIFRSTRLRSRFEWGGVQWAFVWPKELFDFFQSRFPHLLRSSTGNKWMDDHPLLTTRPLIFETRCSHPTWRNPLFASDFCQEFPLGYS
jgi:hypothetical protein